MRRRQLRGLEGRRSRPVVDRLRAARRVRRLHRGHDRRHRLEPARPDDYPSYSTILASVALTFFAYLGFSVITFAAGDLRDPARELPLAMYVALGVTTVTYVLIALGVFGTLTVDRGVEYGETAIAEAARPALGDAGFTIMAIAALLATRRRSTRRSTPRRADRDAGEGAAVPAVLRTRLGARAPAGVLVTAALVLVVATSSTSRAIASVGSAMLARDLPRGRGCGVQAPGTRSARRRRSSSSR